MTVITERGGYIGAKPTWEFNQRSGLWSLQDQYELQKTYGWPISLGSEFGGGYFGGYITYGVEPGLATSGNKYLLIMAPKATGEASSIRQQSSVGNPPVTSDWDGHYTTYNYGSSTSYPAANFCYGLNIAGYSDWYLPSRRESETAFGSLRNLPLWQSGGSEEFTVGTVIINGSSFGPFNAYWTSTIAGHYRAVDGFYVSGYPLTDQFFVRAIRRIPYPS